MVKVSVIIPNYNHSTYLKQRIDSVLHQTYNDIEVIVLDDSSTDSSKEIIEQYRGHYKVSHIIYNTTNSGSTFKQWHKGIQLAKGEYIWIAESDDWCENSFLETIINGLEKQNDTVFGYCQSFCVNDEGRIIFQSNYNKLEGYSNKDEYLERFLTFGNAVFNASMAVFRKEFYYKISNSYTSLKFTGDWIFWAELSRLGSVYITARLLNYFRKHDKDVSSKMYLSGLNFVEELQVLKYFNQYLGLDKILYFNARIKLYNRYRNSKKYIDAAMQKNIRSMFFENSSFFQKKYFLMRAGLCNLKTNFLIPGYNRP